MGKKIGAMTNTWKTAHEAALEWLEMAAHDSGSGSCGGGLAALGEFGPDGLPVVRAQLLARDLAQGCALYGTGSLCCNGAVAGCHLREERGVDSKVLRQLCAVSLVLLDVGFEVHIGSRFCESLQRICESSNC